MPRSYGKKALTQTKSKPADVFEAGTSSKLDTDVIEAASISGGDVKAVASTNAPTNSLATSATVLVACPDSLATVTTLGAGVTNAVGAGNDSSPRSWDGTDMAFAMAVMSAAPGSSTTWFCKDV